MTMTDDRPSTEDAKQDTAPPPDFLAFLAALNKGRTTVELSESLQQLVAAVVDTGKAGSITLTVAIKPLPKGADGEVLVTDKVAVKVPALPRPESIFYADGDNNLVRNNPHQTTLY